MLRLSLEIFNSIFSGYTCLNSRTTFDFCHSFALPLELRHLIFLNIPSPLLNIDSLLNDFKRDLADYMSECELDEKEYMQTQDRLNELGYENVLIFSVEGWPHLDTVIPQLKAKKIKNVTLMPLMMVAGDHANNDMAGDEPDSFKSILEKEGFKVDAYIHGLGENEAVRKLFVEKADQAWEALHK